MYSYATVKYIGDIWIMFYIGLCDALNVHYLSKLQSGHCLTVKLI